jgi:hypothetical protein
VFDLDGGMPFLTFYALDVYITLNNSHDG